MTIGHIDN